MSSSSVFKVRLVIIQGATFSRTFTWATGTAETNTPVDLTGCTARMQIREAVESEDVLLELTTENGRIALGGTEGTVTLSIADEDTSALSFEVGVYDLELVRPDETVQRLMEGAVRLSPEVTR